MNQVLEGVSRVVRVTRTPLSVVAIALIAPIAFSAAIFLFASLPLVVKCVIGCLPFGFVLMVWLQFWAKAKNEPLAASEEYHMAELRYRYLGADNARLSAEQIESIRRSLSENPLRETQTDDDEEGGSQP